MKKEKTKFLRKDFLNSQRGITLIALVITIIIMLILASVSLNLIAGEDGILGRAKEAVEATLVAEAKEEGALFLMNAKTAWYMDECPGTFIKYFNDNYVNVDEPKVRKEDGAYIYTASNGQKVELEIEGAVKSAKIPVTVNAINGANLSTSEDKKTLIISCPSGGGGAPKVTFSLAPGATVKTKGNVGSTMWVRMKVGGNTKQIMSPDGQSFQGEVSYTNTTTSSVDVEITMGGISITSSTSVTFSDGTAGQFEIDFPTYTITFDANGGTGAPETMTYTFGESFSPNVAALTREGCHFAGWALNKQWISPIPTSSLRKLSSSFPT